MKFLHLLGIILISCAIIQAERSLVETHQGQGETQGYYGEPTNFYRTTGDGTGFSECPCIGETAIYALSNDNTTAAAISPWKTCAFENPCNKFATNKFRECSLRKCVVDLNNCAFDLNAVPIDNTQLLGYSYTTCGSMSPSAMESLDGKTIRIMLMPELDVGWWQYMSMTCRSSIDEYPLGCSGFAFSITSNLPHIGNFEVEYVQTLPDEFWTAVTDYCIGTEGIRWGNPDWDTTGYSYNAHLCTLQIWTVCAYAASLGYVDICPACTTPTQERLGYTGGLLHPTQWMNFYRRADMNANSFNSLVTLLESWDASLFVVVLLMILATAFLVRLTSGVYKGFLEVKHTPKTILNEVFEVIWFGMGMFLDMLYPQQLPFPAPKLMILVFEFCQIVLLASFTAGLTSILLTFEKTSDLTLENLNEKGKYLCFFQDIFRLRFEENNPHYNFDPTVKDPDRTYIPIYKEWPKEIMSPADIDDNPLCGMTILGSQEFKSNQGQGIFCDWEFVESQSSMNYYMPTNPSVYPALSDAYNVYKKLHHDDDWNKMLKVAVQAPVCIVKTMFDPLGVQIIYEMVLVQFIFIIFAVVFWLIRRFISGKMTIRNFQMRAFTTRGNGDEVYSYQYPQ